MIQVHAHFCGLCLYDFLKYEITPLHLLCKSGLWGVSLLENTRASLSSTLTLQVISLDDGCCIVTKIKKKQPDFYQIKKIITIIVFYVRLKTRNIGEINLKRAYLDFPYFLPYLLLK